MAPDGRGTGALNLNQKGPEMPKVDITPLRMLEHSPHLEDRLTYAIAFASDDTVFDLCLKESMEGLDWVTEEMQMVLIRAAAKACVKIIETVKT